MTARVLIVGRLTGEPVTRPTRNGGEVTFFKVRVASGNYLDYWSCATFNEAARAELAGLGEGDAVSATGGVEISTYQAKTGETRIGLKMRADRVLALKRKAAKPHPRPGAAYASGREAAAASWASPASEGEAP